MKVRAEAELYASSLSHHCCVERMPYIGQCQQRLLAGTPFGSLVPVGDNLSGDTLGANSVALHLW
jgi:hypothetical protein